ncbi:hypothetical protein Hdeb2414_s0005g00158311 [Helianthus debilis subsp. tardiflorus]
MRRGTMRGVSSCSLPCGMRRVTMRRAATWLTAMRHAPRHHAACGHLAHCHAACAASPCGVRPLGSNPCAHAHDCHIKRRITYHLILATFVLHHARAVKNTKAALGDASVRSAKCAIKAPHRPRHARARARERRVRVRVRVRVLRTLREDTSVCFHETIRMESSTLNTHLSSISPPMWDKVLLSL